MELAKLDAETRKKYQAFYSDLLISEGEQLFAHLKDEQEKKLWKLLGGKQAYRNYMKNKRADILAFLARKYFPGQSQTTYEGFLDLSRILLNKDFAQTIDLTDDQATRCRQLFADHMSNYRKLLFDDPLKIEELVKQYQKKIESVLLPHLLALIKQQARLELLFQSPMNFLATKYICHELEIDSRDIERLARVYQQITAKGDKKLAELKKELDQEALKHLNPEQRKNVELILSLE